MSTIENKVDGQYVLNGDGSYSFSGHHTAPVMTSVVPTTHAYTRTSPIRESHYATRTSPIRDSHYANEGHVTYTTISDETLNVKPREYENTHVTRSPIRDSHYATEGHVTYTTISDETLNVKPRELETTNVSTTNFEEKVTYTTISDETLNAKARTFESPVRVKVVQPQVDVSAYERRIRELESECGLLRSRKPEVIDRVIEKRVEVPVQVDTSHFERHVRELESECNYLRSRPAPQPEMVERVIEKRVEVPALVDAVGYERRIRELESEVSLLHRREPEVVERVVERRVEVPVPVERVVERVVEVPVEVPYERVVERVVEVPVEVPYERVVERVVEKRVEVPVERVVERIVEVEPKKKPVARDLSGCGPFVGFGLVENTAKPNQGYLPVETIFEHGPAWEAGMRLDDDISQIGRSGQPINSLSQVREIVQREAKVGQPLRVVGKRRNGERYEREMLVRTTNPKARQYDDIFYDTHAHQKFGQTTGPK